MSCVLVFCLLWELGLKGVKNLFLQEIKVRVLGKGGCVSAQDLQYLCAFSFFFVCVFQHNVDFPFKCGNSAGRGTSLPDPLPLDLLP